MTWGFVNRVYTRDERTRIYTGGVAEQDPFMTRTVKSHINRTLDNMGFTPTHLPEQ